MSDAAAPEPQLPEGRLEGRETFRQAVRDALHCAAREGWPELILSDADFQDWPLGESAVLQALQAWAHGSRRLTLLAMDFDPLVRLHPRFVPWRVRWEHIITCRKAATREPLALPSALWTPAWALHRMDPLRSVCVAGLFPERRAQLQQELQEWLLRKSGPGFPASVLGL